jgi:hypothetical protein
MISFISVMHWPRNTYPSPIIKLTEVRKCPPLSTYIMMYKGTLKEVCITQRNEVLS